MGDTYNMPITREYTTRGCRVNIDASSDNNCVDINVTNLKSGLSGNTRYILLPHKDTEWYTKEDIISIQNMINDLLDEYGDTECNEILFTNQILS